MILRYKPMYYWEDIKGNERLKEMLRRSVASKKLFHAYLIDGALGMGKKLMANTFAKAIFCETGEYGCKCHSCIQFDALSHSDLVYIRPEKTKTIGVDDLRQKIIEGLNKKPFEYEHKVYIIENAEMMTVQAQNALLRSLENPPAYAVFILLTSNIFKLLPTVLSRCFICKMKPLKREAVYGHFNTHDNRAKIAGEFSGGSLGAAIRLFENDNFFNMRSNVNSIMSCIVNINDLEKIFAEVNKLLDYKDNTDDLILIMLMWFRDVLAYKATNNIDAVVGIDTLQQVIECSEKAVFKSLYLKIEAVMELKRGISANTPFGAALDALAIRFSIS